MSVNVANSDPAVPADLFGSLQKNWGWLMALGIIFVILGTVGLGMTFLLTLASVFFFGVLLGIGGGAQLVEAFKCSGWKGILWHVLIALAYLFAGYTMIANPALASEVLTLMIAWVFIVVGIIRLVIGFQHRETKGWYWTSIGGVISIILGGMILASWPVSGLWVIGLFVAIEMIVNGWSYIFIALAAKKAGQTGVRGIGQAPSAT
jgi:uncharacterized membrane protein HdeD (DUF308 family)